MPVVNVWWIYVPREKMCTSDILLQTDARYKRHVVVGFLGQCANLSLAWPVVAPLVTTIIDANYSMLVIGTRTCFPVGWINRDSETPSNFAPCPIHLASIKSLTCLLQSSTRSLPWIQVKLWLFIISSNCCWIWNGCLWCLYNLSIKEYYLSDWSIKRNIFLLCINCVHLSVSLITLSGRRSLSHLLLHCNNCQFWSISLYEWGWNWINTL